MFIAFCGIPQVSPFKTPQPLIPRFLQELRRSSQIACLDVNQDPRPAAPDGEEFAISSNGDDWAVAWHSAGAVSAGIAHGANAFCVTADNGVVVISNDGARWGWPGGRPEGHESWEQTLRREVLEEACALVRGARLIGFCRAACLSGREQGRVLVRSVWRAGIELMLWKPRFEIAYRRVVQASELLSHLWMEDGFEPIYHRAMAEAGLK